MWQWLKEKYRELTSNNPRTSRLIVQVLSGVVIGAGTLAIFRGYRPKIEDIKKFFANLRGPGLEFTVDSRAVLAAFFASTAGGFTVANLLEDSSALPPAASTATTPDEAAVEAEESITLNAAELAEFERLVHEAIAETEAAEGPSEATMTRVVPQ